MFHQEASVETIKLICKYCVRTITMIEFVYVIVCILAIFSLNLSFTCIVYHVLLCMVNIVTLYFRNRNIKFFKRNLFIFSSKYIFGAVLNI